MIKDLVHILIAGVFLLNTGMTYAKINAPVDNAHIDNKQPSQELFEVADDEEVLDLTDSSEYLVDQKNKDKVKDLRFNFYTLAKKSQHLQKEQLGKITELALANIDRIFDTLHAQYEQALKDNDTLWNKLRGSKPKRIDYFLNFLTVFPSSFVNEIGTMIAEEKYSKTSIKKHYRNFLIDYFDTELSISFDVSFKLRKLIDEKGIFNNDIDLRWMYMVVEFVQAGFTREEILALQDPKIFSAVMHPFINAHGEGNIKEEELEGYLAEENAQEEEPVQVIDRMKDEIKVERIFAKTQRIIYKIEAYIGEYITDNMTLFKVQFKKMLDATAKRMHSTGRSARHLQHVEDKTILSYEVTRPYMSDLKNRKIAKLVYDLKIAQKYSPEDIGYMFNYLALFFKALKFNQKYDGEHISAGEIPVAEDKFLTNFLSNLLAEAHRFQGLTLEEFQNKSIIKDKHLLKLIYESYAFYKDNSLFDNELEAEFEENFSNYLLENDIRPIGVNHVRSYINYSYTHIIAMWLQSNPEGTWEDLTKITKLQDFTTEENIKSVIIESKFRPLVHQMLDAAKTVTKLMELKSEQTQVVNNIQFSFDLLNTARQKLKKLSKRFPNIPILTEEETKDFVKSINVNKRNYIKFKNEFDRQITEKLTLHEVNENIEPIKASIFAETIEMFALTQEKEILENSIKLEPSIYEVVYYFNPVEKQKLNKNMFNLAGESMALANNFKQVPVKEKKETEEEPPRYLIDHSLLAGASDQDINDRMDMVNYMIEILKERNTTEQSEDTKLNRSEVIITLESEMNFLAEVLAGKANIDKDNINEENMSFVITLVEDKEDPEKLDIEQGILIKDDENKLNEVQTKIEKHYSGVVTIEKHGKDPLSLISRKGFLDGRMSSIRDRLNSIDESLGDTHLIRETDASGEIKQKAKMFWEAIAASGTIAAANIAYYENRILGDGKLAKHILESASKSMMNRRQDMIDQYGQSIWGELDDIINLETDVFSLNYQLDILKVMGIRPLIYGAQALGTIIELPAEGCDYLIRKGNGLTREEYVDKIKTNKRLKSLKASCYVTQAVLGYGSTLGLKGSIQLMNRGVWLAKKAKYRRFIMNNVIKKKALNATNSTIQFAKSNPLKRAKNALIRSGNRISDASVFTKATAIKNEINRAGDLALFIPGKKLWKFTTGGPLRISLALGGLFSVGQEVFNIGTIGEEFSLKRLTVNTLIGASSTLLFMGGLARLKAMMKAKGATDSTVNNTVMGIDVVESSGDVPSTIDRYADALVTWGKGRYKDAIIQGLGATILLTGNVADMGDSAYALGKKTVPLEVNFRMKLSKRYLQYQHERYTKKVDQRERQIIANLNSRAKRERAKKLINKKRDLKKIEIVGSYLGRPLTAHEAHTLNNVLNNKTVGVTKRRNKITKDDNGKYHAEEVFDTVQMQGFDLLNDAFNNEEASRDIVEMIALPIDLETEAPPVERSKSFQRVRDFIRERRSNNDSQ